MPGMEALRIDLKDIDSKDYPVVVALGDSFFASLEQDEILGGDVEVRLNAREMAEGVYVLDYSVKGVVRVVCDRCLDEMEVSVDLTDKVRLDSPDSELGTEDEGDDLANVVPADLRHYDASWDIYETIVLSLPIQRVHEDGQCNKDMLERLRLHQQTGE